MSTYKKYTFNSGGINLQDLDDINLDKASKEIDYPLSIKTPLEISSNDSLFKMHYKLEEVLKDQLKNLIYTEPGERLCFASLGTSLKSIITKNNDLTKVIDNISDEIRRVVSKYIKGLELTSVEAMYSEEEKNKYGVPVVIIKINYSYYEKVSNYNMDVENTEFFTINKKDSFAIIKIALNN